VFSVWRCWSLFLWKSNFHKRVLINTSPENFHSHCVERRKKFQLWTAGVSHHNSCGVMVLDGSRITTAPWDFLCLYFESRLHKEFDLAKQDYISFLPLLSFRTTSPRLSDYFSFRNFSPAQNCREAPYRSDQWFGKHKNMDNVRWPKRSGIVIRDNTIKNALSKDQAESISPVWKSANLAITIFLRGP